MEKEFMLDLYRRMVRIRKFEDGIIEVYIRGLMPGLAHCYSGEEAVAVGTCAALRDDDYITSTHRGHGHLIAKGGKVDRMMAEVLGKEPGYNKGRGGTMHIADVSLGILGANGIVGGGLGIAAGAGISIKQRHGDQVSVGFFGDGASNQGLLTEAMNMAAVWKLPVIYVCENNLYAQYQRSTNWTAGPNLGARAEALGVKATSTYGQDILGVYDTMTEVVSRVRAGGGPEFVEFQTYRWGGHHVGDPGKAYRPADEIDDWKVKHDPIKLFGDRMLRDRICTQADLDHVDAEEQTSVDNAIEFAKSAPFPSVSEVSRYVYP